MLQDTPDGSYAELEKKGKKQKAKVFKELFNGLCNYRVWLLAACYAYSFGVEVCSVLTCLRVYTHKHSVPHMIDITHRSLHQVGAVD